MRYPHSDGTANAKMSGDKKVLRASGKLKLVGRATRALQSLEGLSAPGVLQFLPSHTTGYDTYSLELPVNGAKKKQTYFLLILLVIKTL